MGFGLKFREGLAGEAAEWVAAVGQRLGRPALAGEGEFPPQEVAVDRVVRPGKQLHGLRRAAAAERAQAEPSDRREGPEQRAERAAAGYVAEGGVAPEEFVAAEATEGNGESRAAGRLRDDERVRAVHGGLIDAGEEAGISSRMLWALSRRAVWSVPRAWATACAVSELVVSGFVEADGEGAEPGAGDLGGADGERGGVDAAGEEDAERHVGDQLPPHRAAKRRGDPLHGFGTVDRARGRGGRDQ